MKNGDPGNVNARLVICAAVASLVAGCANAGTGGGPLSYEVTETPGWEEYPIRATLTRTDL